MPRPRGMVLRIWTRQCGMARTLASPFGRAKGLLQICQIGAHRQVCEIQGFPSGGSCRRSRLMRGRAVRFDMPPRFVIPKPPLGDQGEVARRSRDGGDEKVYVLPHYWRCVANLSVLIPSVSLRLTASLGHQGKPLHWANVAASQNAQHFSSSGASRHLSLPPLSLRDISP